MDLTTPLQSGQPLQWRVTAQDDQHVVLYQLADTVEVSPVRPPRLSRAAWTWLGLAILASSTLLLFDLLWR